jgi:hypothetical protein
VTRPNSAPRSTPPLWTPPASPTGFMRGAKPTTRENLMAAMPYTAYFAPPAQCAYVPAKLSYWLNNQTGDCHDDKTEVLTETGWQRWPEYDGRSLLGTMNQTSGLLEFQAPLALKRREHDGPMAFSNHKRLDFGLTPNHRIFHRPYVIPHPYTPGSAGYGPFQFSAVDSLPTRCLIPGATTGFIGTEVLDLAIGDRAWTGTDFLRLLGLIVSDGWVGGAETTWNRISFCCFREDRREMVASLAARLHIHETVRRGVWEFADPALAVWLRANAFTGNEYRSQCKRVPDLVKIAHQSQIEEFLTFFGDQSDRSKYGSGREFYSSSRRMIDDLQELLLRVGKCATIGERAPRTGGVNDRGVRIEGRHPSFTLHEASETDIMLTKQSKCPSVEWDRYKGEVFCATVPNSTLVTRRNGRVLISSNCVTAEEAFAKACNNPEIFIPDAEVGTWAKAGGFYNGADLSEVMDAMAKKGFVVGNQTYDDGPYAKVDYSNETDLQSALSEGPVKIAIDADALPKGAGNQQGWFALGGSKMSNYDHCVGLAGYGPAEWLFGQLGVPCPTSLTASQAGYLLFTWSTIGFIDHPWLMSTCSEAWVRTPTTVGVPPLPAPPAPPLDWFNM